MDFVPRHLSSQSAIWKGLSKEWVVMMSGARSMFRNGMNTKFWVDPWVDSGIRLIDKAVVNSVDINLDAVVADFFEPDGNWSLDQIGDILPADELDLIAGMSSPKTDRENDIWVWGAETNGKFTIRSAYNLLSDLENEPDVDVWASIWKWRGPHRVKHFLWLASHGRLLTNNERHRRHLAQDASCAFCNHPDESLSHVLRDCLFARNIWSKVKSVDLSLPIWTEPIPNWISYLLHHEDSLHLTITAWSLWKE
ncbi:Putative ribonuclease H protein At1g65750 [Linum perenne]